MNLITRNLRRQAAQQFIDNITSGEDVYYVFIGRPDPYADDNTPPQPYDTVQQISTDAYQSMIAGRRVGVNDAKLMVPRYNWTANTVYAVYSHDDVELYDKQFYVLVSQGTNHSIFKCLDNNNGSPSSVPPDVYSTSPQDEEYSTSDGYKWKYMYSIEDSVFKKFSTPRFIPVVPNANVVANAVSGTISHISIPYQGSHYNSYGSGVIQVSAVNGDATVFQVEGNKSANTDFFKNCAFKITSGVGAGQQRLISEYVVSGSLRSVILTQPFDILPDVYSTYEISPAVVVTGDGDGFVGRALVNAASSNSIYKIEITNQGNSFTYATTTILANTGGTSNAAILTPVYSPPGGHGSDVAAELGARHMCVSANFNADDVDNNNKLLDANDYRNIGLIRNPLLSNVVITYSSSTTGFADGEIVTQADSGASGEIVRVTETTLKLTNVSKFFGSGNSSYNLIHSSGGVTARVDSVAGPTTYIDQTYKLIIDNPAGQFQEDELVTQGSHANGIMYFANNTVMRITGKKGVINVSDDVVGTVETVTGTTSSSTSKVTDVVAGDLVPNSGQVMYIENVKPVKRYNQQSETLKLILQF
jgi:hypothetical protein